ncbi:MAG: zinc ribbon domain-containing protein [Chloroflexi bacterium]|nr:zinc ribbon domain-containing protein [Chloroflexota bacterium]
MDALTLIVSLALAVGAFGLILYPLWQQTRLEAISQGDRSGQTLEEYQARYQAALDAIKDLMFDQEMGKISAEDYERLLAKTKLEAAEIRHQIDRLSHSAAADKEAALDVEIERLVAQLRISSSNGSEALLREVDTEIELLKNIQFDPAQIDEAVCPHCGHVFLPGDTFCTGCGQALPEGAANEPDARADVCPACGYAYQPDDAFCAKCGQALDSSTQVQSHEGVVAG